MSDSRDSGPYLYVDENVEIDEGDGAAKLLKARTAWKRVATACEAPNMNPHAERSVRTIRMECPNQMVFVRSASLEGAVGEYVAYCDGERGHQGVGNEIPSGALAQQKGAVDVSERLGGLLQNYQRSLVPPRPLSLEVST